MALRAPRIPRLPRIRRRPARENGEAESAADTGRRRRPRPPFGLFREGEQDQPTWLPIDAAQVEAASGRTAGLDRIDDWDLVLIARRVPHIFESTPTGPRLAVRPRDMDRALAELIAYERENSPDVRRWVRRRVRGQAGPTLAALVLLALFSSLAWLVLPGLGLYPERWLDLGEVDSTAILSGQYWRLATALTLHADPAHLVGNLLVGGVFILVLCRELGSGLGWAAVVGAGVLGNLLNTVVMGPGHLSIGFSTAVFGTAGVLGGLHGMGADDADSPNFPNSPNGGRRWWVPVAAGLGLLSLLGVGGERTDVGAHLFGFAVGVVAGLGLGWWSRHRRLPGRAGQVGLYLGALGTLAAAWLWAFSQA